jgi:hypothetical protein
MLLTRVVGSLALALGLLGVAACAGGAYGIWRVAGRLHQANDKAFDAVDRGLRAVEDRVPVVQQRVRDSKLTTAEIDEAVRSRAGKKIQERIVTELGIERRVETLSERLQTADIWLEASADTVRDVRRVMELGNGLGANVDPASADEVLEQLASLRGRLQQAEQAVEVVRGLSARGEGESVEDRLARLANLLARILLTLSDVDRRLDGFMARLSEVRADAQQFKVRTDNYILLGSLVCYGILAWAAAGQAALCGLGWRRLRRGRTPG